MLEQVTKGIRCSKGKGVELFICSSAPLQTCKGLALDVDQMTTQAKRELENSILLVPLLHFSMLEGNSSPQSSNIGSESHGGGNSI